MVIRTQKDKKLQTLIEVCTDFASLSPTTSVHRPAEQVFAVEEEDDREEEMFAVVDRQQWSTQRAADPPLSPELQQMFALARRMGYEMRPIARRFDAPRQTPGPRSFPNKDYRAPFRPRDYSRTKCFSCGQLGHTQVRCPKPDLTHTGLYVIDSDRASSFSVIPSVHPDNSIIPTSGGVSSSDLTTGQLIQPLTRVADIQISATDGDVTELTSILTRRGLTATDSLPVQDDVEQFSAHEREEITETEVSREGRPIVPPSECEYPLHYEDPVIYISGTGHWFLEGWIGDHSVEFLVDSGSSVTAMSDIFYRNLVQAGAPVGALQITARTLRSANGTGIEVLGCSRCSVSFLGLRTEFPIIVCSLVAGTDAIIGTDVLGSVLPHTLDIKNGLLFAQGGASLQLHRRDSALSGRVFTVGHSSIPPYSEAVLHCSVRTTGGRALPSSGLLEGLTLFAEETGLIVGRTLVDPSGWKVPVLVSNFGQETVVVSPFTEVGMIAQVTAIQSVTDDRIQRRGVTGELPHHLRDLVDQTSGDLDGDQRRRLAEVLLKYADIFPVPGDPLTGHMDAVEHDINTGDRSPIRCAPRRMSPQKMKKEEDCVAEMLTGGQIEASDSPWSSPVVLVTKKDGGTRFCVDYRQLNDATIKDAYPLPRIDDTLDMLAGKQWFSTLDLASGYWQVSLSQAARAKISQVA